MTIVSDRWQDVSTSIESAPAFYDDSERSCCARPSRSYTPDPDDDLDYCDQSGQPKPAKFASHIWKHTIKPVRQRKRLARQARLGQRLRSLVRWAGGGQECGDLWAECVDHRRIGWECWRKGSEPLLPRLFRDCQHRRRKEALQPCERHPADGALLAQKGGKACELEVIAMRIENPPEVIVVPRAGANPASLFQCAQVLQERSQTISMGT